MQNHKPLTFLGGKSQVSASLPRPGRDSHVSCGRSDLAPRCGVGDNPESETVLATRAGSGGILGADVSHDLLSVSRTAALGSSLSVAMEAEMPHSTYLVRTSNIRKAAGPAV